MLNPYAEIPMVSPMVSPNPNAKSHMLSANPKSPILSAYAKSYVKSRDRSKWA